MAVFPVCLNAGRPGCRIRDARRCIYDGNRTARSTGARHRRADL